MPDQSPKEGELNEMELHILQHSLGLDRYGQGREYRNHFFTSPESGDGKLCQKLVAAGYMRDMGMQSMTRGMHCYSVTDSGRKAVKAQSAERPKITRSQRRYRAFLKMDIGITFREFLTDPTYASSRKNK